MSERDDNAFVQETLAGNVRAFAVLVDRYQKPIFNLALKMLQGADDAEDVAQAVFLKAYEHLGSYNPRFRFFSWLYRIAMNESLNFLRQRKPFERMEESRETGSVMEDVESADVSRHIDKALKELPPDQRSVVVLRHFEELSYLEIARILQIPEKKVKSRLFSARQTLRTVLVKNGVRTS